MEKQMEKSMIEYGLIEKGDGLLSGGTFEIRDWCVIQHPFEF